MLFSGLIQKVFSDVVTAYQFAHIVRYVQNLFLSVLLVKFGLSLEDIGIYEWLMFTMVLVSQFWISGLRDATISSYENTPAKQQVLFFGWLTSLVLAFLSVGFVLVFDHSVFYINQQVLPSDLILLACLFLVFQSLANIPETILLLTKKATLLTYYALISTLVYFVSIGLSLWWFTDIKTLMLALILVSFLKILFGLVHFSGWSVSIQIAAWFSYFRYAIPFFLIALTGLAMDITDGLFVRHFFDAQTFAIYKYGAREFPLSSLLMHSLSIALIPLITQKKDLTVLKHKATRHMHLLFPVSILLIWLSKPLFVLVYNDSFLDSALIFNMYLLILGSRILLPHSVLLAFGKQNWVFWIGLVEIISNIILSYWWVQIWGLYGLVWATVFSYYLHKCIMLVVIHRHFKISLKDLIHVRWWVFYQGLAFFSFYICKVFV